MLHRPLHPLAQEKVARMYRPTLQATFLAISVTWISWLCARRASSSIEASWAMLMLGTGFSQGLMLWTPGFPQDTQGMALSTSDPIPGSEVCAPVLHVAYHGVLMWGPT